jgi:hypothetical protein
VSLFYGLCGFAFVVFRCLTNTVTGMTIKPTRVASLPIDQRRSLPILSVVDREDGIADFATLSTERKLFACALDLCSVCGWPLDGEVRMLYSEHDAPRTKMSFHTEAPMHLTCLVYSSVVCPYLFGPNPRLRHGERKGTPRQGDGTIKVYAFKRYKIQVVGDENGMTIGFQYEEPTLTYSLPLGNHIRGEMLEKLVANETIRPMSEIESSLTATLNESVKPDRAVIGAIPVYLGASMIPGYSSLSIKQHYGDTGLSLSDKDLLDEALFFANKMPLGKGRAFELLREWYIEREGILPYNAARWRRKLSTLS